VDRCLGARSDPQSRGARIPRQRAASGVKYQQTGPDDQAAPARGRVVTERYYGREATARVAAPQPEPERATRLLPRLRVVTERRPRWGLLTLVMCGLAVVLTASLVGPVLITSAAHSAEYKAAQLAQQQTKLSVEATTLAAKVSELSATGRVSEEAAKLGMVPATKIQYLGMEQQVSASSSGATAVEGDPTVAGQ
jgi:hypothetical protein